MEQGEAIRQAQTRAGDRRLSPAVPAERVTDSGAQL